MKKQKFPPFLVAWVNNSYNVFTHANSFDNPIYSLEKSFISAQQAFEYIEDTILDNKMNTNFLFPLFMIFYKNDRFCICEKRIDVNYYPIYHVVNTVDEENVALQKAHLYSTVDFNKLFNI